MKDILLGALSAGKNHTGRGGKTGVLKVLIIIRIVDGSLTALSHSERVYMYYPQHFVHCLAKIIECIHSNFRVMFSIYGLNLTIF